MILPRLRSDLLEIIWAAVNGNLQDVKIEWSNEACVSVVLASGGYPDDYRTGYPIAGLNSVAFSEYYGNTVSRFGQDVALTTSQLNDQKTVERMLTKQRESIMGVSIDEEVANLVVYQRAFQASAKLLTVMDSLMKDVLNMTR